MEQLQQFGGLLRSFLLWVKERPLSAFLFCAVTAIVVYFFGFLPLYANHSQPIWEWAWLRFLPQYNQEHSKLIPFAVLFLVWYHRDQLRTARKEGSNLGLIFLGLGVLCYLIAARAFQPRVALFGFPFVVYGMVLYLGGRKVARILRFPIALLFFMIPLGAIEQMTFRLQFLIIGFVKVLSSLCGIAIYTVGTSIRPVQGDWGFEIAEGCSGIRSLIAMVMLTAIYVHLCEKVLWKKGVILLASVLFAIVGNAGRIFTIILLGHFGFPRFAGGIYHDWSSQLIFFPIALLCMLGFSRLLNTDFQSWFGRKPPNETKVAAHDT
ncbi:MAG: exosortase/archaeosortase family protein [Verrucomicrobiota bacterium]|nr:exosortase/archaeosortase family protein [Verrucomicrobiota bacterium]